MSSNYKVLSNSLVDSVYAEQTDKDRFFREAKQSQFYRKGLAAMVTKEIDRLVVVEEEGDDPVSNIAMRKALRHLKRLLEIGGLDG